MPLLRLVSSRSMLAQNSPLLNEPLLRASSLLPPPKLSLASKIAALSADPALATALESLVDALLDECQLHVEPTCETGPTPGWKGRAPDPEHCEHRSACGTYCTGS